MLLPRGNLEDASDRSGSPDITSGNQGAEWFVFKHYPQTSISQECDLPRDFSSGFYVVSAYFSGPSTNEAVEATLTVFFPDGTSQVLQQELRYLPPYDQWFAVLIDADSSIVEALDTFAD